MERRCANSILGNFVFVGFNALVTNAVVEDGAMVLHGAQVRGVRIPKDRVVPPGAIISNAEEARQLSLVTEGNNTFKEEVVAVNNEFASGYGEMAAEIGAHSVQGVGPKPKTTWDPNLTVPRLGSPVMIASGEARIIGGVHLGDGCKVGRRVSIRGDEGAPIRIGNGAVIGEQVTFHSLLGETIQIGEHLAAGNQAVLHGALSLGSHVRVGVGAILFKSSVGDWVEIGKGAIVIGVRLENGARVPDGALVLDQAAADLLAPSGIKR